MINLDGVWKAKEGSLLVRLSVAINVDPHSSDDVANISGRLWVIKGGFARLSGIVCVSVLPKYKPEIRITEAGFCFDDNYDGSFYTFAGELRVANPMEERLKGFVDRFNGKS